MFYVYEHLRNDTKQPFYIGKGCGKRARSRFGRTKHWNNIVSKANGFTVNYLIKDIDENLAFFCEEETIDFYRKKGIEIINLTNGGEGSSGRVVSKETIEKISLKNRGVKKSEKSKKLMSLAKLGKKISEETKAKMSAARKGKPPNNKGKVYKIKSPMPIELRIKLGQLRKGRVMSKESSIKKSLATKGKPKSEETKMRMKLAQSNPELRAKLSAKLKAYHAAKNPPVSPVTQPLPWG